ncbi:MAG: alpha/beta hydrolase [Rhodospirillaceae bacterium]|nr:alpha/beta hydrolase [Rhodospirillaceae bacterium]MBT5896715.1 alpha/beta hydrolase [Rhodospirillaceae bacterium]MBT6427074.1 alpha/beta hydrolase [Rhodospirillaceae bacterium]
MTGMISSLAALPSARNNSLPWLPELASEATVLTADLRRSDPGALFQAVAAECQSRIGAMLAGVQAYQDAKRPHRRYCPGQVIWQEGGTRLLDYGGGGRPVLFVPSLVNGARVLDLTPDRGLLSWLRGEGFRPFLMDWGAPGDEERLFSLDDYICSRLSAALDVVLRQDQRPPALAGYCMGGNLALSLALRRRKDISGLALLATPWDFHAGAGHRQIMETMAPGLESLLQAFGVLPVDVLQALFAALDPGLAQRKFRHFATLDPESPEAAHFVALEDWVNDGVPLAAEVARVCLLGWYGDANPSDGGWMVDGEKVDPAKLDLPVLLAIPENDRIVPVASAQALADAIPGAEVIRPAAGHIGMVVGRRGMDGMWRPLSQWLEKLWLNGLA